MASQKNVRAGGHFLFLFRKKCLPGGQNFDFSVIKENKKGF